MPNICIHATITGKVQGVFYRAHTRDKARSLNLSGWVKNNPNGTVELEAYGEENSVMQLVDWLKEGSPEAIVVNVEWELCDHTYKNDFKIIYE